MNRLGLRTRLTVLVIVAAAVTLAVLTAGFNLLLRSNLDTDANRVLAARNSAALEEVSVRGRSIAVKETPDLAAPDTPQWIFSGNRAIERPPARTTSQRLADSFAGGPRAYAEDSAADLRLLATPVVEGGRRLGTVVSAISLEPYEHSAAKALVGSLLFAAAALALIVIATRLVVTRALRPVAQMTSEAAAWSEHDLGHRFNVSEPHDELTQLAATFDDMLGRLASALRHEQLFSAELSHELRTPLAAISTEAQLALRRERMPEEYRQALSEIEYRASQMQRMLETLLAAARAESLEDLGTAPAKVVGEQAIEACEATAVDRGMSLELTPPEGPLRVDVDADTAERILAPLIENACRYGHSRVEVAVRANGGVAEFLVSDDGPGLSEDDPEALFQPGSRGRAGSNGNHTGAGLGLALSRRLARAAGGEVSFVDDGPGATFVVQLPAHAARPGGAAG